MQQGKCSNLQTPYKYHCYSIRYGVVLPCPTLPLAHYHFLILRVDDAGLAAYDERLPQLHVVRHRVDEGLGPLRLDEVSGVIHKGEVAVGKTSYTILRIDRQIAKGI